MSRVETMFLRSTAAAVCLAGTATAITTTSTLLRRPAPPRTDIVVRGQPSLIMLLHSNILEPPEVLMSLTNDVDDVVALPYLRDGYYSRPAAATRPGETTFHSSSSAVRELLTCVDHMMGEQLPVIHVARGLGLEFALRAIATDNDSRRSQCLVSIDGIDGPHVASHRRHPACQNMQLGLELALFSAVVGTARLRTPLHLPDKTLAAAIAAFAANPLNAVTARRELTAATRPPHPTTATPAVAIVSARNAVVGIDPTGPHQRRTHGRVRTHTLPDCDEHTLISNPRFAQRISAIIDATRT